VKRRGKEREEKGAQQPIPRATVNRISGWREYVEKIIGGGLYSKE